jgi:signal transduction histidine kinase
MKLATTRTRQRGGPSHADVCTSHELRTPLTAVLGFAQLLQSDALEPHQQESVTQILSAGRHLLQLMEDGRDPLRSEPVTVPVAIEVESQVVDVVSMVAPLAAARGLGLTVDLSAVHGRRVRGNELRFRQVLLNLLTNAVKYNRPGGTIEVRGEVDDARLRVLVTDTGPGIPAENLGCLFMPFERLGAEDGPELGSGLGLSLAQQLTEVMGGSLTVRSECGVGSTFTVELPLERRVARQAVS